MAAFGLSVLFFVGWLVLGYPLGYLCSKRNLLQGALLAPACGIGAVLLPVFWLSRLAWIPVGRSTAGLTATLAVAVLIGWLLIKRRFPWRQHRVFAVILLGALAATGWPMIFHGFAWLAYVNNDMAYYALSADRLMHHAFLEPPDMSAVIHGRDYSTTTWFSHIVLSERIGSDFLLAWASALTKLSPHEVYMPLLLSFHLALISAAGALVCQIKKLRTAAVLTCALTGVSAMASRGVMSQLMPQVLGLTLMTGAFVVLAREGERSWRPAVRTAFVAAVLLSALALTYNEVIPFLLVSLGIYWGVSLARRRLPSRGTLATLAATAVFGACLLNLYLVQSVEYMLKVARSVGGGVTYSAGQGSGSIFPYFLMPSGLANLWGILEVTEIPREPVLSLAIMLGGALLLIAVACTLLGTWRRVPIAVVTCCMMLVGARLFAAKSDFPTFKLAMFVQPFLLGSLMVFLSQLNRRRLLVGSVILLGLCQLRGQIGYVYEGSGLGLDGGVQVPFATADRVLEHFREVLRAKPLGPVAVDTDNYILADLESVYVRGREADFLSFGGWSLRRLYDSRPAQSDLMKVANRSYDQAFGSVQYRKFDLHNPSKHGDSDLIVLNPNISDDETSLLISTPRMTVFNRFHRMGIPAQIAPREWKDLSNQLIFINSQFSTTTMYGMPDLVAFYQLERDPLYRGTTMAAFGHYLLFRVIHPSEPFRLVFDLTTTLNPRRGDRIPDISVIGSKRWTFSVAGSGGARIVSPPIEPQVIDGVPYVGIDMGSYGSAFPMRHPGLMRLYGTQYALDTRKITAFARDLSAISEQEYAHLRHPANLSVFPLDLQANSDMEFSGIYEDGWMSRSSYLTLRQPATSQPLRIRGRIPNLGPGFTTVITVGVNGTTVLQQSAGPGVLNLQAGVQCGDQCHVSVKFSRTQPLPGGDARPVGAHLDFIGFDPVEKDRHSLPLS